MDCLRLVTLQREKLFPIGPVNLSIGFFLCPGGRNFPGVSKSLFCALALQAMQFSPIKICGCICLGLLLAGWTCTSAPDYLPHSLQEDVSAENRPMRQSLTLAETQAPAYEYQVLNDGVPEEGTVAQWTEIEAISQQRYHCLEVYDVYAYDEGYRDYAVLEYTLDLGDTASQVAVLDYRFRADADTAYYTDLARRGAKLRRLAFDTLGHPVYELGSYEYYDTPELSRLTYWTPAWGAILIYGGNQQTFELVALPEGEDQATLDQLRQRARKIALDFQP